MADDTRSRLITATGELFRRYGYNGTSLKQVTEAADASMGSLYHHFPGGKSDLTRVVLETTGTAYQELFELIWDSHPDPGSAIETFFDAAAEVLKQTDFIDPCSIGGVAREIANTDEVLRETADRVFDGWIDSAATRLRDVGLPAAEAEELAVTLVAAIEGGFLHARTSRNGDRLRMIGRQQRRLVEQAVAAASVVGGDPRLDDDEGVAGESRRTAS